MSKTLTLEKAMINAELGIIDERVFQELTPEEQLAVLEKTEAAILSGMVDGQHVSRLNDQSEDDEMGDNMAGILLDFIQRLRRTLTIETEEA